MKTVNRKCKIGKLDLRTQRLENQVQISMPSQIQQEQLQGNCKLQRKDEEQLTGNEIQLTVKKQRDPRLRLKQNFFNSPIQDPRQKSNEIESNESKKLKFTQ